MLLMPKDKKRVASLIVADLKPDYVGKESGGYDKEFKKEDSEDSDEDSSNIGLEACAEEIIACVKSGDAKKLAMLLKDAVDMSQGDVEVY